MNICVFKGNLTRDPELRFTANNTAVCKIGLAVNERVKINDQWQDKAHFFDLVCFGKRGEVLNEHHRKGHPLLVRCRAQLDQWEDKQTGQPRSKVQFVIDDFEFIKQRDQDGGGF